MDDRYRQYAQLILTHSLQMKQGERVLIQTDPNSVHFAEVIAQEVIRAGGHPVLWLTSTKTCSARLLEGNDDQLEFVHPAELALAECECRICIDAPQDYNLPKFDPARVAKRRKATGQWADLFEPMRWVLALFPTQYLADRMGVSFAECEDLVLQSTVGADWDQITAQARTIEEVFKGGSNVHIVADGTDLRFSIADRPAQLCYGRRNLPDGETFWAPHHESVEGVLTLHDPQFDRAGWVHDMRLVFRQGKVVEASATEGMDRLELALNADEGARYLGEFGIGVNTLIHKMTGNILMDEKIAGTVHLALGNAYPEVGGTNKSRIHWDLVLDLRRGGAVYVDGRLVCLDGRWLVTEREPVIAVGQ